MWSNEDILGCLARFLDDKAREYALSKMEDGDFILATDAYENLSNKETNDKKIVFIQRPNLFDRKFCTVKRSSLNVFEKHYEDEIFRMIEKIINL